ncbi:MAG: IS110 family transposase, partial [Mesorhizobium sp.]
GMKRSLPSRPPSPADALANWSWFKAGAKNVANRRGTQKAIVALARRLAVIMPRTWLDATELRWKRQDTMLAAT